MEINKEIKTIEVDYKCPKCEKGYLRPTGEVLFVDPPKFSHKCNNCEFEETFDKTYPFIKYE